MLDSLASFGSAFAGFMSPGVLFTVLWATFLGIVIGALPGLTATMGVALMTTLTFTMPHTHAILVLVCVYVGAIYGGSRTGILLNIPGTAANAAATLDGHELAKQGRAGRAMGIATTGSVAGSLFGVLCLAMFTPALATTSKMRAALPGTSGTPTTVILASLRSCATPAMIGCSTISPSAARWSVTRVPV